MNECLFCKIVKGEIPCYKVFENDKVLAFLDIYPHGKGHTLIIPKKHAKDVFEMNDEDLSEILVVGKKVAVALEEAINADGYNFLQNNREYSGQVVMHYHMHVIPRYEGQDNGGVKGLGEDQRTDLKLSEVEFKEMAELISSKIKN